VAAFRHDFPIRVRYAETDQMGFAYHGGYFAWFEAARVDMLDAVDLPYKTLEREGFFLPVVEAQARFRKPIRFDDRILVTTVVEAVPRLRFQIDYEVRHEHGDGPLLCTGYTQHAFINRDGELIRPPISFVEAMERELAGAGAA
jgi:acyl-CoA thioester hydrolase